MKIGIIREGKNPPDERTPFTPEILKELKQRFASSLKFAVQSSPSRSYSDGEYMEAGIDVVLDISDCDVFFGVKEVPVSMLISDKTYFFFSHTIKKQPRNKPLLQAILKKNIRLIDYELLKDDSGNRVVAFGRWAGIVGAYNAFWTYGQKTGAFQIKRAHECFDRIALKNELSKVLIPEIKILVTGTGRVGSGALEVLNAMNIKQVTAEEFLHEEFEEPVFVQLHSQDYNQRKSDGGFHKSEFYEEPGLYEADFLKYVAVSDMLIAAAFWNPRAPRLFELKEIVDPAFRLSIIADVTCDIAGSIPTTFRASAITDPVYDVDRVTKKEVPPFADPSCISVMAVDNLPCELSREASLDFTSQLANWVIPALLAPDSQMLQSATIAQGGKLMSDFEYLRDYVYQDE